MSRNDRYINTSVNHTHSRSGSYQKLVGHLTPAYGYSALPSVMVIREALIDKDLLRFVRKVVWLLLCLT
jgi:hypothetical protein